MVNGFFLINWTKTLFFNFKYFKFRTAIRLPVLIFGKVSIHKLDGSVCFDKNVLVKTGLIKFGLPIVGIFDKHLSTVFNIHGDLIFKGNAVFGSGCSISIGKNSKLSIGENFSMTANSAIVSSGGENVEIGKNCLISWKVLIMNTDFHKILVKGNVVNMPEQIEIGDDVWIGTETLILKGSLIPNGSIIGAKSIVNKKLNFGNSIYAGNPLTLLKSDVLWEK